MTLPTDTLPRKSRLAALLDRFAQVEDPRDVRRILHPLRKGHGARNMATVRHFALNLVRTATDKRSIKSRRKLAGWSPNYLQAILSSQPA